MLFEKYEGRVANDLTGNVQSIVQSMGWGEGGGIGACSNLLSKRSCCLNERNFGQGTKDDAAAKAHCTVDGSGAQRCNVICNSATNEGEGTCSASTPGSVYNIC